MNETIAEQMKRADQLEGRAKTLLLVEDGYTAPSATRIAWATASATLALSYRLSIHTYFTTKASA
jgi:hypothetical protein